MTTALIKAKSAAGALRNKLKGHDKSGSRRGKLRYPISTKIGGGRPETSKSITNKVNVCGSPKEVRQNIIRYYKNMGYVLGSGNVMLPPDGSDLLAIMIPRLSSIKPLRTGKGGRAIPPQDDALGGMIF